MKLYSKTILAILIFLLGGFASEVYSADLKDITLLYQSGQLKIAKEKIDSLSKVKSNISTTTVWYTKGYIYKDYFKSDTKSDQDYRIREEALKSFKKAYTLDTTNLYKEDIVKNMQFISSTLYEEAMIHCTNANPEKCIEGMDVFEEYISPTFQIESISQFFAQYKIALGDSYIKKGEMTRDTASYTKAIKVFEGVISEKEWDFEANFHLGLLYYNMAVDIIEELDVISIEQMLNVQNETTVLFHKALPYMQKCEKMASMPELRMTQEDFSKVLEALAGIHFSLKDFDVSDGYVAKLKELSDSN